MVVTRKCWNPAYKPIPRFCPMLACTKGGGIIVGFYGTCKSTLQPNIGWEHQPFIVHVAPHACTYTQCPWYVVRQLYVYALGKQLSCIATTDVNSPFLSSVRMWRNWTRIVMRFWGCWLRYCVSLRTQWPLPWQLTSWESISDIILGERSKYWGEGRGEKGGETGHCCNMTLYYSNNIHVRIQFHCNSSKYLAKIFDFLYKDHLVYVQLRY